MTYKVLLIYFRQTGKFLAAAETTTALDELDELAGLWGEVDDMRRLGQLPGLRPGAGRDLFILVDVPDHPRRALHLVIPPCFDEDDVTPPRIATGEMRPLVRVPLDEIPRTSTRDIVKIDPNTVTEIPSQSDSVEIDVDADTEIPRSRLQTDEPDAQTQIRRPTTSDDEITPVSRPIPKPPDEP